MRPAMLLATLVLLPPVLPAAGEPSPQEQATPAQPEAGPVERTDGERTDGERINGEQSHAAELEEPPVAVGGMLMLAADSDLRTEPSHGAELLGILEPVVVEMLQWQPPWALVRAGQHEGWVNLREPQDQERLDTAHLQSLREERLATALSMLGAQHEAQPFGPYQLYTDVENPNLLKFLGKVAEAAEPAWQQRYGLEPAPREQPETVVLFAEEADYRRFERDQLGLGLQLSGHTGAGTVALYLGQHSKTLLARVLLHELSHLSTHRSFSGEAPAWLDEGIAEDLALSNLDSKGRVRLGRLDPRRLRQGRRVELYGPLTLLEALGSADDLGLAPLIAMDGDAFRRNPDLGRLYALSGLFLRFLLEHKQLAEPTRNYLAQVAAGNETAQGQDRIRALEAALGRDLDSLSRELQAWCRDLHQRILFSLRSGP